MTEKNLQDILARIEGGDIAVVDLANEHYRMKKEYREQIVQAVKETQGKNIISCNMDTKTLFQLNAADMARLRMHYGRMGRRTYEGTCPCPLQETERAFQKDR